MTFPDVELAAGPPARGNTALPDCVRSSDSQETTPHASASKTKVFPPPTLCDCNLNDFLPGAHDVAALRATSQHPSQEQFHIE